MTTAAFLTLVVLAGCQSQDTELSANEIRTITEHLLELEARKDSVVSGDWSVEQVIENDVDVTPQHDPADGRWISFESGGNH
jgi:hypothetical protein